MIRLSHSGRGAALAVVLAFAPVARAADVDPLLPADTETVVSFNVRQALDSDIMKKYALEQFKQTLQGNDAQKFLTELGLDPLRDLDRVVLGSSGKDQADTKFLAVMHGKFDPEKLYKAAEAQTRKDADHFSLVKDGKDVIFKYQPDTGNPVYGTVVDDARVILGSDKKVIVTALAAAGQKKPAAGKDLTALVTRMDDKATLWMASAVNGKLEKVKLPGPLASPAIQAQLAKMDSMTAVVRVTEDVNLAVNLGMRDTDSADEFGKTVNEALNTVKGLLPFAAAQDPRLKALVEPSKSLKSEVKDRSIVITAKLPGDAIGKLMTPAD